MHRKRVTSELHDSYFRLVTIKHSISKIQWAIVWALNYYLTQLSSSPRGSWQEGSRQLETRCGKESHTRPRGSSGTPIEWTPKLGEQKRHNVTVITVGSRNYSYVRSPAPSHMQPLNNTFGTLQMKWEVKYICKEVFLRLPSCVFVLNASFLPASVIIASVWIQNMYVYVCIRIFIKWVYICM